MQQKSPEELWDETHKTPEDPSEPVTDTRSSNLLDTDFIKALKNFPKSVANIWTDTAKIPFTAEGRKGILQLAKEVGILTTVGGAIATGGGAAATGRLMESGQLKAVPEIFKFYGENYDITSKDGRRKFMDYVENHPAEFAADAIGVLSMGAGAASKIPKTAGLVNKLNANKYLKPVAKVGRAAFKGVEYVTEPGSAIELLKHVKWNKNYSPEVEMKIGRDAKGQPITHKTKVAEMADRILGKGQGTSEGNVPAMVLSDDGKVNMIETSQFSEPGDLGLRTQQRFTDTKAGLEESGRKLVDLEGISEGYSPFSAVEAGEQIIHNFRETQMGNRSAVKKLHDEIESITYTPEPIRPGGLVAPEPIAKYKLPPIYEQTSTTKLSGDVGVDLHPSYNAYFNESVIALNELGKSDSKLLSNADYKKVKEIFDDIFGAAEDGFTIGDMDKARTNFRTQMDIALQNGEVTRTGSGTVASKMYSAMTSDFYNMLDRVVALDPDSKTFPKDLPDKVKKAKAEWKKIIDIETTEGGAGKFLIKNQHNPRFIVDNILKGDMLAKKSPVPGREKFTNLDDLKELIGDKGWKDLQPALVNRVLDMSLRNENWSPTGLKNTIAKINAADKNKMANIFGQELNVKLNELAEFSARLQREPTAHSKRQANFLERIAGDRTGGSILLRIGELISSGYVFATYDYKAGAAIMGLAAAANWAGSFGVDKWRNSAAGRKAMLEGLTFGGTHLDPDKIGIALKIAATTGLYAGKAAAKGGVRQQRAKRYRSETTPSLERLQQMIDRPGQPGRER